MATGGGEGTQQMPDGDLVMIFQQSLKSRVFSSEENCLQAQHQQVFMGLFGLLVLVSS